MFISFTRKYNRLLCPLLIWEHVLCWSRLSHNIVTRSMRLEPTFPRSTHFAAELIFNNLFQRGRSLYLTFQRGEHLLWVGKQYRFIPCLPAAEAADHKTQNATGGFSLQPGCSFSSPAQRFPPSKVNLIMACSICLQSCKRLKLCRGLMNLSCPEKHRFVIALHRNETNGIKTGADPLSHRMWVKSSYKIENLNTNSLKWQQGYLKLRSCSAPMNYVTLRKLLNPSGPLFPYL